MSRSIWKPLYNNKKNFILEKNFIYNRSQIISSEFLNQTVNIHNGTRFFEITINDKMIGLKFGEFAPTRKLPLHKKKKNNKNKKK